MSETTKAKTARWATTDGKWVLWEGEQLTRAGVMALLASMEANQSQYALTGNTILVRINGAIARAEVIATMSTEEAQS